MNGRRVEVHWPDVERNDARFDPAAQLEWLAVTGTCLAPWLIEGDLVWYDAALQPLPGELVISEIWYEKAGPRGIISGTPAAQRRLTLKQWQLDDDGSAWLTSNEGWILCPQHALRGVVVQMFRKDRLQRPCLSTMQFAEYRDAPLRPDCEPVPDPLDYRDGFITGL